MASIALNLDDEMLARVRLAAEVRACSIEELLQDALCGIAQAHTSPERNSLIGMMRDDPGLMDAITEDIMRARETRPLRVRVDE